MEFVIFQPPIPTSTLAVISTFSYEVYVSALSQHRGLEKSLNTPSHKEENQEEDCMAHSAAVTGSFSAQLGCSNPYTYDQFSLQTTEQMLNQIILLQVGTNK